jgi:integrase
MYLRGRYWHYDFTIDKIRYRGSTGLLKEQKILAKQTEERLKVELREKYSIKLIWEQTCRRMAKLRDMPLDHTVIWKSFNDSGVQRAACHRKKLCASRIKSFCCFMHRQYPEIKTVSGVTGQHARQYRMHLEKENISNSTGNDHLAALKMVFGYMKKSGYIPFSPFEEIKKFPVSKVKREIFTCEELELILSNAGSWLYSLFITAVFTGLREGDIALLKRESIDSTCSWITVDATAKTGASVDIPIHPDLRNHLLMRIKENENSRYVFPELALIYLTNPKRIGREVKSFFKRIGISGTARKIAGYKNRVSVKDVHSFRHTFIYLAAENNIPLPVIQSIAGHASGEMTRHYMDHASRDEKVRQIQKLSIAAKTPQ